MGGARTTGLNGRLRDLIRADIIDGRYAPGARLKAAELAARYNTSAIPVREALHQLEGEGIVVLSPNRSATVRVLDDPLLRNIFEVRGLLEGNFTRWFVEHHTPAEFETLAGKQKEYDRFMEAGDLAGCRQANREFHAITFDRHYNGEALAIYARYTNLLRALFNRFPNSPARVRRAGAEHWDIVEAIRAHDEEKAVRATAVHTAHTCQYLIQCILSERAARRPLLAAS
jgi:DNA-binding GntR family transcriptional regulator